MSEREDYAEGDDTTLVQYPWLALIGLTLPYSAVAFGWWMAGLVAAGRKENDWWDKAGNWIYCGVALAVLAAVWLCVPVFRRVRHPGHVVLAGVSALIYFAVLMLFSGYMYVRMGGPFP